MAKPLCSSLDVVPKTRAWPHQVMVARSPAEKRAVKLLVELKSSRANIIGNVRPLKPDRFSCLRLRDQICTTSSEQVENKEGKRIANAANG